MRLKSIRPVNSLPTVCDITVAKNHNFFIRPKGSTKAVLVHNCQQFPALSQQALLKPIEEPPKDTVWIICTMTPEKMIPAIAKRCLRLQVKQVDAEILTKRLALIAKKEGVDFRSMDGGMKVLKTIADFANGGVRDAISSLESVLLAMEGNDKIDANTVLANFLSSPEAELDQAAANVLVAVFKADLKLLIAETQASDNVRGILNKLRWLIDFLLSNSIGKAKFTPYSGRLFGKIAKEGGVKVSLATLISLQSLLVDVEFRMNSLNIEERVLFTSSVGNFIVERAK